MFKSLKDVLKAGKGTCSHWTRRKNEISIHKTPFISKDTRIFTIGSCFASNLAATMKSFGLSGSTHPGRPFYTTKAIKQELEKLVGNCQKQKIAPYWETPQGFQHAYMNHPDNTEYFSCNKDISEWEASVNQKAFDGLKQANVVIVTLGLIEAWYHPESDTFVRSCPPVKIFDSFKAKFCRLTVADMKHDLRGIYKLVCEKLKGRLVISVSPIPIIRTFTSSDVRVANSESKSRIRAAVSEFIDEFPDVYYFPSYEIITTSERMNDFMLKDARHLHKHALRYVISRFMEAYCYGSLSIPEPATQWLTSLTKTFSTPQISDRLSLENCAEICARIQREKKTVFIYGTGELAQDFLYFSDVLFCNVVGIVVSRENEECFCGIKCYVLSRIKKCDGSCCIIAKENFSEEDMAKLSQVFGDQNLFPLVQY